MMTLPAGDVLRPRTVAEASAQLAAHPGARLLAGGTDIVPNLKYGMYDTRHLVALRGLSSELRYVRVEAGEGPLHPAIPAIANALHDACGIRVRQLPFYPQRILRLLRERDARRPGSERVA